MDQPRPAWTLIPTEWAVLRDQLTSTSKPSLSSSSRLSSFILIALSSITSLIHLTWIALVRFKKPSAQFKRPFRSIGLGYHQPNLSLLLPIIFLIHAVLNIASVSSLLWDANRLKFKGHTLAIQQLNFSLLLSAGILLIWALVYGLPPSHIGLSGFPIDRLIKPDIPSRRKISPKALNLIGYLSLSIVILIPLPCIIISTVSTDKMNNLDDSLLGIVNLILERAPEPVEQLIGKALKKINQLDQTSNLLYTHIRMLSAIHLIFTLTILVGSLWISVLIIRSLSYQVLIVQQPFHQSSHSPSLHGPNISQAHLLDHLPGPKPALILNPKANPLNQQDIELGKHIKTKKLDHHHALEADYEGLGDESTEKIVPKFEPQLASLDDNHDQAYFIERQTQRTKDLSDYIKKIKLIAVLIAMVGLSFVALNLCILANLFQYPTEISLGDLLILTLEWSTWIWNGSISPLIGIMICFMILKQNQPTKAVV